MRRLVFGGVTVLAVLLLGHGQALAGDPSANPAVAEKTPRYLLGIGLSFANFSTTFEQDFANGGQIFISLEGNLGLPSEEYVPAFSLLARVGSRGYLAANIGQFRRSRTIFELDESLRLDDLLIEAGAKVDLFFNVTDVDLAYGHAYLDDGRVRIIGKFGASVLDLDLGLSAEGSYSLDGVEETGRYKLSTDLLIPVPLVGVLFDVNLTPRWVLSSSVELFYLPVGQLTAEAWRARIQVRHSFNRSLSAYLGYGSYSVEVIDETDDAALFISYDVDGATAGLSFTF